MKIIVGQYDRRPGVVEVRDANGRVVATIDPLTRVRTETGGEQRRLPGPDEPDAGTKRRQKALRVYNIRRRQKTT